MDPDRLQVLLDRHFDQILSGAEREELERMLLASPKARDQFWAAARWHALVRHWGETTWGREETPVTPRPPLPASWAWWGWPWSRWAAAFAAVLIVAAASLWLDRRGSGAPSGSPPLAATPPRPTSNPTARDTGIAVLTRILDADWGRRDTTRYAGEVLSPGALTLLRGVVQIEFVRGARVVVEGPADLELASAQAVELRSGTLRAEIPDAARGFAIGTPGFRVVGGAGEFGCRVTSPDAVEAHAFAGVHELYLPGSTAPRKLPGGEALTQRAGAVEWLAAQRAAFLADEEIQARSEALARQQLEAWRHSSRALDERRDLVVHLDFEEKRHGIRTLVNRARHAPKDSGASFVGCDWVEGRWPGKGAVEFKHRNDRLWLSVPENVPATTFLAWVRVDTLPYEQHALLTAEGPGGKINWAIIEDGTLSLGIQVPKDGRGWLRYRSQNRLHPRQLGTWLCLASVYAADGTVSHYLNGEPAGTGRLAEWKPGRLGHCEIGNAVTPTLQPSAPARPQPAPTPDPPRNFLGRLDEFSIFSAALSPDDIRRLHKQGREGRLPDEP